MEKMINTAYPYSMTDMKATDIYERFGKYQQEWLALTSDEKELLAHSPDLSRVVQAAKEKGVEKPLYVHIPRWDTNFVPSCLP